MFDIITTYGREDSLSLSRHFIKREGLYLRLSFYLIYITHMRKENLYRLILIYISVVVIICLSEFILSLVIKPQNKYCLWLPSQRAIFKPYPGIMPGVGRQAVFATNSEGVRGDELTNKHSFKILAVGGSTTECLYIDQQKSWPHILQEKLSSAYKQDVWVGNIGRSGLSTTGNLIELKYLLPQYQRIDLIIALVGFNDLQSSLLNTFIPNSYKSDEEKIEMVFVVRPPKKNAKFYENSALWNIIKKSISYYFIRNKDIVEDSVGSWYIGARNARKRASEIVNSLPDLSINLSIFENNINEIIDLAQKRSIRIIFLTQPCLWNENLTVTEKDLLWFGFTADKKKYYSIPALASGLNKFNTRLIEICKRRNIECIDLESFIAQDTTVFYDDVHFNESGCSKVADVIASYFINNK